MHRRNLADRKIDVADSNNLESESVSERVMLERSDSYNYNDD